VGEGDGKTKRCPRWTTAVAIIAAVVLGPVASLLSVGLSVAVLDCLWGTSHPRLELWAHYAGKALPVLFSPSSIWAFAAVMIAVALRLPLGRFIDDVTKIGVKGVTIERRPPTPPEVGEKEWNPNPTSKQDVS
jgi:hypothetical protein